MKNLTLLLLLLAASLCSFAQIKKQTPISKKDTVPINKLVRKVLPVLSSDIVVSHDVIFYEKPNYQGATAKLVKKADGSFSLPFPLTSVSFKVPAGKIVYIKICGQEFPDENAYIRSANRINLTGICGVRTDDAVKISVVFNGISTEIHNKDCMRFAGTVKVRASEDSPEPGLTVQMPFVQTQAADGRVVTSSSSKVFNWNASQLRSSQYDPHYNNTNTIFNNNPVPVLTDTARNFFKRIDRMSFTTLTVGRSALQDQRVRLLVITDLTSSHKTCDLCDDFSSGVKMEAPVTEVFPLNKTYGDGKIIDASHRQVVAGPYTARGSRDGFAITAHGGTVKNFRVHLTVNGL